MKPLLSLCLSIICLLSSSANTWGAEEKLFRYEEPLMGTLFSIQLYSSEETSANTAADAAFSKAKQLEKTLSSFAPESELSQLNAAPANKPIPLSSELRRALTTAVQIAHASRGAFDPTLGPAIRLWKRSITRGELPTEEESAKARAASGYKKLNISPDGSAIKTVGGMRLDLGAIGKGIAMDAIAKSLRSSGIERFCISNTSDILAGEAPPEKTAWIIKHQGKEIPLRNAAISTSGDGQQHLDINGVRYSHVIDPQTGLGKIKQRQTSILAPTAQLADALATACSLLSPADAQKLLLLYKGTLNLSQSRD